MQSLALRSRPGANVFLDTLTCHSSPTAKHVPGTLIFSLAVIARLNITTMCISACDHSCVSVTSPGSPGSGVAPHLITDTSVHAPRVHYVQQKIPRSPKNIVGTLEPDGAYYEDYPLLLQEYVRQLWDSFPVVGSNWNLKSDLDCSTLHY